MRYFLVLTLLLLSTAISPFDAIAAGSNVKPPCTENIRFGGGDVNHQYNGCPDDPEGVEPFATPKPPPPDLKEPRTLHVENKKPKFRIKELDMCVPGREQVNHCTSNPDIKSCPDGSYPVIRQLLGTEGKNKGRVIRQYIYCPGDEIDAPVPEENLVREIRITIDMFRNYPIKGSTIRSAPDKFSLRNGHTHFWASEETQEFKSNLSGSDVRIKAIPIQWNWNYGDGAKRNLNFPGEAMPSHTLHDETPTSHSYSKTGKFGVKVTTLYRGEFSVDGGAWQAIPGQAAVPSNSLPIDVWRTEKELIATD